MLVWCQSYGVDIFEVYLHNWDTKNTKDAFVTKLKVA